MNPQLRGLTLKVYAWKSDSSVSLCMTNEPRLFLHPLEWVGGNAKTVVIE